MHKQTRFAALCALLVLAGSVLAAAQTFVSPGIHPISGRRYAQTMSYLGADWLDRAERVQEELELSRDAQERRAEALDVLAQILGGGPQSRLYKTLVLDRKLAADAGSWYSGDAVDTAEFGVYAAHQALLDSGLDLEKIDRDTYAGTSVIGKVGVEAAYEDELHGSSGYRQLLVNAEGRSVERVGGSLPALEHRRPRAGNDLSVAIDARLQAVMKKLAAGEPLTLVTVGGSITTGHAAHPPRERGWAAGSIR